MLNHSQVAEHELLVLDSLVTSIRETRTAIAALQALELSLLASAEALADEQTARLASRESRQREIPRRSIAAEIGAATRTSDRTVQRRMGEASVLGRDFPLAMRALGEGRVERGHVSVILETGGAMTDASARADFERAAVALAERETPGRLRPLLRSLAARLDPTSIDVRHAEAATRRGVWVTDLDDGMAQLMATLPAAIAHAIRDRLTRFAHAVVDAREPSVDVAGSGGSSRCAAEGRESATDGGESAPDGGASATDGGASAADRGASATDKRTVEQLRADVLADILLTSDPSAVPRFDEPIRATVQVVVPALTLMGADDQPAELTGRAPIDADTARRLAGSVRGWDRLLTQPVTGAVLAVDRYRPSEDQRRLLRARDERCRFPGCRMPVHRCDVDHTVDAARGGATCTGNLAHLCRRHHSLKHVSDWTVLQRRDGTLEWTSPTGRLYLDEPPSTVRFRASSDPPPF